MCGILALLHAQPEGNSVAAELQYNNFFHQSVDTTNTSIVKPSTFYNTAGKMLAEYLRAPLRGGYTSAKAMAWPQKCSGTVLGCKICLVTWVSDAGIKFQIGSNS